MRRTKVYPTSTILLLSDNREREGKMVHLRIFMSNQSIVEWRKLGKEVVGVDSCMIGGSICGNLRYSAHHAEQLRFLHADVVVGSKTRIIGG